MSDMASVLFRALFLYALHEYQLGNVTEIEVMADSGSVSVSDNGRGMGFDRVVNGLPYVQLVSCQLDTELQQTDGFSVQLQGVGLSIINTFSESFEIVVSRKGFKYSQAFVNGKKLGDTNSLGPSKSNGSQIKFRLNKALAPIGFSISEISSYLNAIQKKHPELSLRFNGQPCKTL